MIRRVILDVLLRFLRHIAYGPLCAYEGEEVGVVTIHPRFPAKCSSVQHAGNESEELKFSLVGAYILSQEVVKETFDGSLRTPPQREYTYTSYSVPGKRLWRVRVVSVMRISTPVPGRNPAMPYSTVKSSVEVDDFQDSSAVSCEMCFMVRLIGLEKSVL